MTYLNSFVWINIIFGLLVLISYIVGISQFPEYSESLWGGVQGALRQRFIISMLCAALGYLIFFSFVVYSYISNGDSSKEFNFLNSLNVSKSLNFSVFIFLVSAAIWMPTLILFLQSSNSIFFYLSNAFLWVTALAAISIFFCTTYGFLNLTSDIKVSLFSFITLLALFQVVFHCLIFDAIIFVLKFPR